MDNVNRQTMHPLIELTTMRVREFLREREAVFWVFVFPVLMTFALGIAFRNTAPDKTFVAIEGDAQSANVSELTNVLTHSADINAIVLSPDEATRALRSGKVSIVVKPNENDYSLRFDPTRPESRTAKLIVDDVLQRAKGRTDVVTVGEEKVTETGARYVDFLVPGLNWNEFDGERIVGAWIHHCDCPLAKTAQTFCGDTHAAFTLLAFIHAFAADLFAS